MRTFPAWEKDTLPEVPDAGRRRWTSLIGPGLLMVGANIGGGEWLFGPLVTAQYGGKVLWLATVSILVQVAYNLAVGFRPEEVVFADQDRLALIVCEDGLSGMRLADLTRDAWTLLPGSDDFLAELRTKQYDTLTYARSASEPEDISLFERRRKRNIALYASKEKLAARGRFYNEDDLAAFDVLDYDIDLTALPDRQWIDGRTKMRLKARAGGTGQLTIKLADSLNVRSLTSDRFGRLFYLRVTNQNTLLINLPSYLNENEELTLTVSYVGRLEPQSPDRETLDLEQDGGGGAPPPPMSFPDDISVPRAEPSFLYSNRSFWYPQSTITDYATAHIRISVQIGRAHV